MDTFVDRPSLHLTARQKLALQRLQSQTSLATRDAVNLLKQNGWKLDAALQAFELEKFSDLNIGDDTHNGGSHEKDKPQPSSASARGDLPPIDDTAIARPITFACFADVTGLRDEVAQKLYDDAGGLHNAALRAFEDVNHELPLQAFNDPRDPVNNCAKYSDHQRFADITGASKATANKILSKHGGFFLRAITAFLLTEEEGRLDGRDWDSVGAKAVAIAKDGLQRPKGISVGRAVRAIELLADSTGMTFNYAHKLLSAANWRWYAALSSYEAQKRDLPAEAFLINHILSQRTGLSFEYAAVYLKDNHGSYADAVSAFSTPVVKLTSDALSKGPPRTCFLSLSAELRNQIYENAFPSDPETGYTEINFPAITQTCAQIRGETIPMWLSRTRFTFDLRTHGSNAQYDFAKAKRFSDWLEMVGEPGVRRIRGMKVFVNLSMRTRWVREHWYATFGLQPGQIQFVRKAKGWYPGKQNVF